MKVKASTLVEFVLALSIIGICFTIASIIFARTNRSTTQFKEAMDQTEFQSILFEQNILDTIYKNPKWESLESVLTIEPPKENSANKKWTLILNSSQKEIWKQELYKK